LIGPEASFYGGETPLKLTPIFFHCFVICEGVQAILPPSKYERHLPPGLQANGGVFDPEQTGIWLFCSAR
jgi:hypothetical protein